MGVNLITGSKGGNILSTKTQANSEVQNSHNDSILKKTKTDIDLSHASIFFNPNVSLGAVNG